MNPPYAGRRVAADTGYKVSIVRESRRRSFDMGPGSASRHSVPRRVRDTEYHLCTKILVPRMRRSVKRCAA